MLYKPRDLSIFDNVIVLLILAPIPMAWICGNILKVMNIQAMFVAALSLAMLATFAYEIKKRVST